MLDFVLAFSAQLTRIHCNFVCMCVCRTRPANPACKIDMATEVNDKWFDELMEHIKGGNLERVAELLHAGHDVNRVSEEESLSPLSLACQHGRLEMAKLLLEHGADVSVPGKVAFRIIRSKNRKSSGFYR